MDTFRVSSGVSKFMNSFPYSTRHIGFCLPTGVPSLCITSPEWAGPSEQQFLLSVNMATRKTLGLIETMTPTEILIFDDDNVGSTLFTKMCVRRRTDTRAFSIWYPTRSIDSEFGIVSMKTQRPVREFYTLVIPFRLFTSWKGGNNTIEPCDRDIHELRLFSVFQIQLRALS